MHLCKWKLFAAFYCLSHLYEAWTKNGPTGGLYAFTASGWMQDSVFESWMKYFVGHTKNIQKPILLIYDGHGSHMTYLTIAIARENGIIILCLPPHTSHALQPLDVGVFALLKKAWKAILKKWFRESRLQNVSKAVFPSLLNQLTQNFSTQNAVKGFQDCGLYPINKAEVERQILSQMLQDTTLPSTSKEVSQTPSNSKEADGFTTVSKEIVGSPLKELKLAILSTLSPPASSETKVARMNSRTKRKRIQTSAGEMLTADMVATLLQDEHEEREIRKHAILSNLCQKNLVQQKLRRKLKVKTPD